MSLLEIDKFVQTFVQKCVQVIVQSRLGTSKRTQTRCNPHGRDWFYLDIPDFQDIAEQTARCLKLINTATAAASSPNQSSNPNSSSTNSTNSNSSSTSQQHKSTHSSPNSPQCFVRKSWKICCEISLRNSDGISLVLEYWIFSNVPVGTYSTNSSSEPSNQHQQQKQQQQTLYQLLSRMSGMLKSLITLSRSTPAYKVSSKGQSADSYVICYRVFPCDEAFIMDTVSGGTSSPSVFSTAKPLGTIKSFCNELSISLIYRTSMSMNSAEEETVNNNILAALDGGRNCDRSTTEQQQQNLLLLPLKDDHFKSVEAVTADADYEPLEAICDKTFDVTELFKPLNPAFASFQKDSLDDLTNGTPFSALLPGKDDQADQEAAAAEVQSITSGHQQLGRSDSDSKENEQPRRANGGGSNNSRTSAPISIPPSNGRGLFSSPPKSSAAAGATLFSKSPQTQGVYSTSNDSFVFVELNAPFASDDREFGSFFHGPSPTFVSNPSLNEESVHSGGGVSGGADDGGSSEMINELSQQLAELESNAPQFDSFVESICITESQELKFET